MSTKAAKSKDKSESKKRSKSSGGSLRVVRELKDLYSNRLLPLERKCLFHKFHNPEILDSELSAKPSVLLVGQYSTGKTSFIKQVSGEIET